MRRLGIRIMRQYAVAEIPPGRNHGQIFPRHGNLNNWGFDRGGVWVVASGETEINRKTKPWTHSSRHVNSTAQTREVSSCCTNANLRSRKSPRHPP